MNKKYTIMVMGVYGWSALFDIVGRSIAKSTIMALRKEGLEVKMVKTR